MKDVNNKVDEQERTLTELEEVHPTVKQVEQITRAVDEAVSDTSLPIKVEELRTNLENLSEEVKGWRKWRKDTYLEAIESLKSQVEEIESEWNNVASSMNTQRERLETVLQSFPGILETATLKALSLRITHLERLVSQLVQESSTKSAAIGTRKQLIISLVALGITVILWGVFIVLSVVK